MKIAIALKGDQLTEKLDDRFGRSKYFCVYDMDINEASFIKNKFTNEEDGVGKQVVDLMIAYHVELIVATEFGRKVRTLLENKKIQMVILQDTSLSGEEVLQKIKTN